jgi:hypothetical protein
VSDVINAGMTVRHCTVVLGQGHNHEIAGFPYGVDDSPDTPDTPLVFWEGSGHTSSGGLFTAGQALKEVLVAYQAVHGHLPTMFRGDDPNQYSFQERFAARNTVQYGVFEYLSPDLYALRVARASAV